MADPGQAAQAKIGVENQFGELAVAQGLVTSAQIEEAMRVQAQAARAGFRLRLGDILVQKGYLTPERLRETLKRQRVREGRRRVGNFEILSKLGGGAMAAVFKARQLGMDREVALKILAPQLADDPQFRERFMLEARATARLNHPHIVAGVDVGCEDGVYYFAMEFVDGETLADRLVARGGRLPEKEALEYCRQVALALQHAHTHGILHRDVKPDNILVDRQGVAKLADLGLARMEHPGHAFVTQPGLALGTPYYISPEQARGQPDLTPGTDLYSLGATLYCLVTGRPPYEGETGREIMRQHIRARIPDPRKVCPALSPAAAAICTKLLQKSPRDRYRDGASLAEDLQRAIEGAPLPRVTARAGGRKPGTEALVSAPSRRSHAVQERRRATLIILAVAVAILLVLGGVTYWALRGGDDGKRPAAPTEGGAGALARPTTGGDARGAPATPATR